MDVMLLLRCSAAPHRSGDPPMIKVYANSITFTIHLYSCEKHVLTSFAANFVIVRTRPKITRCFLALWMLACPRSSAATNIERDTHAHQKKRNSQFCTRQRHSGIRGFVRPLWVPGRKCGPRIPTKYMYVCIRVYVHCT